MEKDNIGVIGGSGVYSVFEEGSTISVETPYGKVKEIKVVEHKGKKVYFLARHGIGHQIPPHKVNYRANIYALYKLDVKHIFATNAVGAIDEKLELGDFVLLLNVVNGSGPVLNRSNANGAVRIWLDDRDVNISTASDVGAILLTIAYEGEVEGVVSGDLAREMMLDWNDLGGELKVLIWSDDGKWLGEGEGALFRVEGNVRLKIESIEAADPLGNTLSVKIGRHSFALKRIIPNPFKSAVSISYILPEEAEVRLGIYDVSGRLIKTLIDKRQDAGEHTVIWNGRDGEGRLVSNGVYFVRIESGKFRKSQKLLLMR